MVCPDATISSKILLILGYRGETALLVLSRLPNALSEGAWVSRMWRERTSRRLATGAACPGGRALSHNKRVPARSGNLADHSRAAALCRASQIATHSPSDNTNITIEETPMLSRLWGARAPSDRTNGGSWARQAPSNKIRRRPGLSVFPSTILD